MKKRNTWAAAIIAAAMAATLLVGCSKEAAEPEAEAAAAPKYKMILIVKSMDNPFWDSMIKGANIAAEDLNIEIESLAPIKPYNVEEQLRFMENGRPVLCVEVEARGRQFWELNNPEDVARIEAMMADMGLP